MKLALQHRDNKLARREVFINEDSFVQLQQIDLAVELYARER